jgi:hypothetical protein
VDSCYLLTDVHTSGDDLPVTLSLLRLSITFLSRSEVVERGRYHSIGRGCCAWTRDLTSATRSFGLDLSDLSSGMSVGPTSARRGATMTVFGCGKCLEGEKENGEV